MNIKVKELVEWAKKIIDAPNNLEGSDEGYDEWVERVAKQILSHPDLALIDRGKTPCHIVLLDEDITYYPIIPLAEALKEVKDEEVER